MDDTTVIAPSDDAVTQLRELAWSREEPDTEPDELWVEPEDVWSDEQDAAYARGTAKLFLWIVAVIVVAVAWMVLMWATHRHHEAPAVETPGQHATVPVLSTVDAAFARSLQNEGISPDGRIDGLIRIAQHVCTDLGSGLSKTDIAQRIHDANPDMNQGDAKDFVGSAVEFYCPQEG